MQNNYHRSVIFSLCYLIISCYLIVICLGKYENFTDTYISPIPKIIHRVWMVFEKGGDPKLPEKYVVADKILKDLHPDWIYMEWTDQKILNFIAKNYPFLLSKYVSFEFPIMRHDFSRYVILRHYGGVFIQHSYIFRRNISPLLGNAELVLPYKFDRNRVYTAPLDKRKLELNNNFMASIPQHKFWDFLIYHILTTSASGIKHPGIKVMSVTGPWILTTSLQKYQQSHRDEPIVVLDNKYLMPFYISEKDDPKIREYCIDATDPYRCFELYPEAFAYTMWSSSWTKKGVEWAKIGVEEIMKVATHRINYDKLFIVNMKRSPDRWARIAKELFDADIKFDRFEAVDGYNVKIKDFSTGKLYTGLDLKRKIYKIGLHRRHEISCESGYHKAKFTVEAVSSALTAGNLGVWCSKVLIRDMIIKNQWNRTVVLEDDFYPNWDQFEMKLNEFISFLPKGFDQAYLDSPLLYFGSTHIKDLNSHVKMFSPKSDFYGDWAYMLSFEGAQKLNYGYKFTGNSDEYIRYLSKGLIRSNVTFSVFAATHNFSAKHYSAYHGRSENSVSSLMGCRTNQGSSRSDCDENVHIDQVYVILQSNNNNNQSNSEQLQSLLTGIDKMGLKDIKFISADYPNMQIKTFKNNNNNNNKPALFVKQIDMTKLNPQDSYSIICDPSLVHPLTFTFTLESKNIQLFDELQRWCTMFRIWRDAKLLSYRNIMVTTDNMQVSDRLNQRWSGFYSKLPLTFDIAILSKSKVPITETHLKGKHRTSASLFGYPNVALFSNKAIHSFLATKKSILGRNLPHFYYFWCFRDDELKLSTMQQSCETLNSFEIYAPKEPLFH